MALGGALCAAIGHSLTIPFTLCRPVGASARRARTSSAISSAPRGPQQCGARRWNTISPRELRVVGLDEELVQLLDRVVQVVRVHVADVDVQLVGDLGAERRPVRLEDVAEIVLPPRLGDRACRSRRSSCSRGASGSRRRRRASRWLPRCPTDRPIVTCRRRPARTSSRPSSSTGCCRRAAAAFGRSTFIQPLSMK